MLFCFLLLFNTRNQTRVQSKGLRYKNFKQLLFVALSLLFHKTNKCINNAKCKERLWKKYSLSNKLLLHHICLYKLFKCFINIFCIL